MTPLLTITTVRALLHRPLLDKKDGGMLIYTILRGFEELLPGTKDDNDELLQKESITIWNYYNTPHRYYHNFQHLLSMVRYLMDDIRIADIDNSLKVCLLTAAVFHDVKLVSVNDATNVACSINYFSSFVYDLTEKPLSKEANEICELVTQLIECTDYSKPNSGLEFNDKHLPEHFRSFIRSDLYELCYVAKRAFNAAAIVEEGVRYYGLPKSEVLIKRLIFLYTVNKQIANNTINLEFEADFTEDIKSTVAELNSCLNTENK